MSRRTALLASTLALAGCSSGPAGIWLLEIPWQDGGGCQTAITENFTDGYVPGQADDGDADWTYDDEYEGADAISFVQIETYGDGTAVLVVGTEAFPGVQEGDDWVFAFERETTQADWANHQDGYGWQVTQSTQSEATYTFTLETDERASVSVEGDSTDTELWQETDEWDVDQVGVSSQLRFEDYVVYDDPDFGQEAQYNTSGESDCSGELCELKFTTACSSSGDYVATLTDYENSDYYDYLSGVGQ